MSETGLVMMRCDKRTLTLSVAGCARAWTKAEATTPNPWEGIASCKGCRIGAASAGKSVSSVYESVQDWKLICPRCRRHASRMIAGRLCVSCYNRAREVRIGRNGKGGRPTLTDRLQKLTIYFQDGNGLRCLTDTAIDREELMIVAAQSATGPLHFVTRAARWAEVR